MAKNGRGWHGDATGHANAGRKGGLKTAKTHGSDFYRNIGKKGGKVAQSSGKAHTLTAEERERGGERSSGSFEPGSERARQAGKKGGHATAQKHGERFFKKIGRQGGKASH